MRASEGDRLIVHGRHVGEAARRAEILEVHGHDGEPPYLVRWDDGHESTFYPSSDSTIEHQPAAWAKR